eukprot:3003703-Rhodomonas_salina.1
MSPVIRNTKLASMMLYQRVVIGPGNSTSRILYQISRNSVPTGKSKHCSTAIVGCTTVTHAKHRSRDIHLTPPCSSSHDRVNPIQIYY